MKIAKGDFDKIVEYIKNTIVNQPRITASVNIENDKWSTVEAIPVVTIVGTCQNITLEQFLDSIQEKKQRVKKEVVINEVYKAAWKAFWELWPYTKSVPGTDYKSGAVMKKDEKKMYEKWVNALETGNPKITIEQMQYAAECYLEWGYADSKRLGKNELQYRNGMEPWLNQEQYLTYKGIPMPKKQVDKVVHENSTDM